MKKTIIDQFAQLLIHNVRDRSVRTCNQNLSPTSNSPVAKRWQGVEIDKIKDVIVPDCVDETIFSLLHAIDEGSIKLSFLSEDGEMVDLNKEGLGELAGFFMGGWRKQFSSEKLNDDFADLV